MKTYIQWKMVSSAAGGFFIDLISKDETEICTKFSAMKVNSMISFL